VSARVALVPGVTGVVGRRLAEHLAAQSNWDVIGIARRPPVGPRGYELLALDLTDAAACRALSARLGAVTHVFYCARHPHSHAAPEPIEANLTMLRHLIEALEPVAHRLQHVHLVQGSKYYGSELGPYKTPAKESDPRVRGDNWYYAQEDWLVARAQGKRWSWSASRPHGVCDHALEIARSMARVIAVYAAILKECGSPLDFPGTQANFAALYQCTDATLLAQAMAWIATEPQCANEAFNVTNGELIRWQNLWPRFAAFFGMAPGPVRTIKLADSMADKAPVWERIVAKYHLAPTPYAQTALWSYGDFIFNSGYDIISDTLKLRRAGFWETVDTESMFLRLFAHLRANRIIP
jgi:nucleoside-diphosphate-sugar epimerase